MADATQRESCVYFGRVMHKRLRPFVHRFRYRVFTFYLDLDELPTLGRRSRLFSYNAWNLFSFHDSDHGARDGSPLRPWIEGHLAAAGIDLEGGAVRLLCFPRVLGYVFNPLSIWFCYHADGQLKAVLYEVSNTFGQWHGYLIAVDGRRQAGEPVRQCCDKEFYVSPFIGMQARYDFRLAEPAERLSVLIRQWVPEGELLVAAQTGRRRGFDDRSLLRAFLGHPLVTLKVMAGIHWEAFRLWRKGARITDRPPAPSHDVTRLPAAFREAAE